MLTKKSKWQFHKNPEAGSTGRQAAAAALINQAADLTKVVLTRGDSGAG